MSPELRRRIVALALGTASASLAFVNFASWKVSLMPHLTPRVDAAFEKTRTVCFGRLLIDVPDGTEVIWGDTDVPLGVNVYPGRVQDVVDMAAKKRDELNAQRMAGDFGGVSRLVNNVATTEPFGRIVAGYDYTGSVGTLEIHGYFAIGTYGVVIDAHPLTEERVEVEGDIRDIAHRLQPHDDDWSDIPTAPGSCIGNAFLPDGPGVAANGDGELVAIGFRLKQFPDVHLSIQLMPGREPDERHSLSARLGRLDKQLLVLGQFPPFPRVAYLRRGDRQVGEWKDGYEGLARMPEAPKSRSHHDFRLEFSGAKHDPSRPYLDVRLASGVDHDTTGDVVPSISDEEAIALWDRLTDTIRPRPTDALRR